LASVDQSGSRPAAPAGAGRYSAVLNGIRPGACGSSASGLRCLPGATGTTGPPMREGTPEPGVGLGRGGDRVNSSPAWQTRPSSWARDKDEHLSGDEKPLGGGRPRTAHLKGTQTRPTRSGARTCRWPARRRPPSYAAPPRRGAGYRHLPPGRHQPRRRPLAARPPVVMTWLPTAAPGQAARRARWPVRRASRLQAPREARAALTRGSRGSAPRTRRPGRARPT
jgi:hypothetical protein